MNDGIVLVFFAVLLLLPVWLLLWEPASSGSFHVYGPSDPECPSCGGICEEHSSDQTSLEEYT